MAAQMPMRAYAQDKVIRFAMPQDFTKIYTFVTSEYSQGQRDYFSLVNKRGGVGGYRIEPEVSDHGNDLPRAIESYERAKSTGAVAVDPLSTPVAVALTPRALEDQINLITAFSGRSDAANGEVFPYIFPLTPNYWTQAALIVDYFRQQDGGDLAGKKICFVHIDTPFGKEPIPILEALAERDGFELQTFPYTPPGNDQSAIWPQVRRARPDWVLFWGAAVGQTVALTEAIRNGLPMERMSSSVWLSESDMQVVGASDTVGVLKVEPCVSGREPQVIKDILSEVIEAGEGAGPEEKVGTSYYNYGVLLASLMVEGVRLAAEKSPDAEPDGAWLNAGLTSIDGFDQGGFMPATTITEQDHQGGGKLRVSRWNGEAFEPQTDFFAANQDIVWEKIRESSEAFAAENQ
ncbi:MAG: ABC transporter substrate-binding protein [Salipiger thiooxidans]